MPSPLTKRALAFKPGSLYFRGLKPKIQAKDINRCLVQA